MRLFCYGTLMRGEPNAAQLGAARFLAAARTRPAYSLVLLGRYPALLSGGTAAITGELYEVDDDTLRGLDAFEGPGYRRVEIALEDGSPAQAYVLAGQAPPPRTRIITSGDWRRR